MKLWVLRKPQFPKELPTKYHKHYPTWEWAHDTHLGFVIRADSEEKARRIAQIKVDDYHNKVTFEGQMWLDPKCTCCNELIYEGKQEIIQQDINMGKPRDNPH